MNKKNSIYVIARGAIYTALYIALCYFFQPISFNAIQVRIAESLCILPIFDSVAIVAITLGCLLSNLFFGGHILDVIFGSLATLIGLSLILVIKKNNFFIKMLPTILSNTFIIPYVIKFAYGIDVSFIPISINPILFIMITVCIGEVISVYGFGFLLYKFLLKHKEFFK